MEVNKLPATSQEFIEASQLDNKFREEIINEPGGERIAYCFACGTCAASCPVRSVEEKYNPRKIIRMALLGMKDEVLSSDFVWLCSACYSCQERCPQGVKITDIMTVLKNLAIKNGYIHPSLVMQIEPIKKLGRIYEIDDFDNRKREKAGLPPIKPKIDVVERIFKISGLKTPSD